MFFNRFTGLVKMTVFLALLLSSIAIQFKKKES